MATAFRSGTLGLIQHLFDEGTCTGLSDARLLEREIERLPERFRLPVVLCDLAGMTRDQAADVLRCTDGAVRGRLAKARELLKRRLTRRGFTLALPMAAPGAIPANLFATTVRAAAGGASGVAAALATTATCGWLHAPIKLAGVALLALGITTAGFVYFTRSAGRFVTQTPIAAPAGVPTTTTIEGRILDLEGRPVAGATVTIKSVRLAPDGKLDAWIDEIKRLGKRPVWGILGSTGAGAIASVTTERDGRFRFDEIPREGIATASVAGPGIETSQIYILTREVPTIRVKDPLASNGPMLVYYGARFDHVAARARPIVGTIRDKDTGAPIAGVRITGMPSIPNSTLLTPGVDATSDAHGRYQVDGLPTSDLEVDPGRTVRGTVIGPDDQPIGGAVEIRTLDVFQSPQQLPATSHTFVVTGLPSGRYRLDFIDHQHKLAGSVVLKGDEKEAVTVKLQPWGTVVGRVVDDEGKPRTDVQIFSTIRERPDSERGDLRHKPTVDAHGRFRIEGLVPGVKYDARGHSPVKAFGPILQGVQVAPGEVKDIGDIKMPAAKQNGE